MTEANDSTFIGELPASRTAWEMAWFSGQLILLNKDHPPHTVIDGKLQPIELIPTTTMSFKPAPRMNECDPQKWVSWTGSDDPLVF